MLDQEKGVIQLRFVYALDFEFEFAQDFDLCACYTDCIWDLIYGH